MSDLRGRVVAGAAWGIVFWSAYAVLEYCLYSVAPLFQGPLSVFTMSHWRLSGLLFDCYWILGAAAGGATAAVVAPWDRRTMPAGSDRFESGRLPASISLLAAVLINLGLAVPVRHFAWIVAYIAAVLAAAILWVLRRPNTALAHWVDLTPFLLGAFLIAPLWLSTEALDDSTVNVKFAVVVLCLLAIFGLNRVLQLAPRWHAGLHFMTGLILLAAVVVASGLKSGERKAPVTVTLPPGDGAGRPPVVLVSLDTTRADHTSVAGYSRKTTPNLAALAGSATVFPNAMATYDMTLSAHASMFTGVYPSWHGADFASGEFLPLDRKLPTLAEILRGKGYLTAAMVANSAYLTPQWGLARGFSFYEIQAPIKVMAAERRFELRHGMRGLLNLLMQTTDFDLLFLRAEDINDLVFRTMEQPGVSGHPFFLFVNYMDSHAPYAPPAPFDTAFLADRQPVPFARHIFAERRSIVLTRDEYERLAAQYDGGIAYNDYAFGQLVQWLKARGLYDKALIIVAGDHGESFGERGRTGHGSSIHADQIDVPLMVKYPGQHAGAQVEYPVSLVDLMPTVLETLGLEIPGHVQGRSLRRLEQLEHREILVETAHARALRMGPLKLIVNANGKRELYDVSRDPTELHDLYAGGAAQLQPLEAAYQHWMQSMPKRRPSRTVDAEELRRLKSLGYVQ